MRHADVVSRYHDEVRNGKLIAPTMVQALVAARSSFFDLSMARRKAMLSALEGSGGSMRKSLLEAALSHPIPITGAVRAICNTYVVYLTALLCEHGRTRTEHWPARLSEVVLTGRRRICSAK